VKKALERARDKRFGLRVDSAPARVLKYLRRNPAARPRPNVTVHRIQR